MGQGRSPRVPGLLPDPLRLRMVYLCASAWLQLPPAQPSCIQAAKQIPGEPLASAGVSTSGSSSWGPQPWEGAELGCPWLSVGWMLRFLLWFLWVLSPQPWGRGRSQGSGQRLSKDWRAIGTSREACCELVRGLQATGSPCQCSMAFPTSSLPT